MLHQEMVDKKLLFSRPKLPVNPEFILGDERKTIVLAKISEFFVDFFPDILAVNNPDGNRPIWSSFL
jgi:hypothetical protein